MGALEGVRGMWGGGAEDTASPPELLTKTRPKSMKGTELHFLHLVFPSLPSLPPAQDSRPLHRNPPHSLCCSTSRAQFRLACVYRVAKGTEARLAGPSSDWLRARLRSKWEHPTCLCGGGNPHLPDQEPGACGFFGWVGVDGSAGPVV